MGVREAPSCSSRLFTPRLFTPHLLTLGRVRLLEHLLRLLPPLEQRSAQLCERLPLRRGVDIVVDGRADRRLAHAEGRHLLRHLVGLGWG